MTLTISQSMKSDTTTTKRWLYTYKGITYEIIDEEPQRSEQLLRDFLWCEKKGDWLTIRNRITNGLLWGWLKEIKKDEQGFWQEGSQNESVKEKIKKK